MRLILIFLALAAASLACNMPAGQPTLPPTAPPLSTQDLQELEEQLQNSTQNGETTVTITQQQLNGFIAAEAANQPDSVLTNPSVVLTNGQMEVYGKLTQGGITANTQIVMAPSIDANGNPKMDVVSKNVGSLPVPDVIREQVSSLVDDTLSNYLASTSNQFKESSINITEGQMTITGTQHQP